MNNEIVNYNPSRATLLEMRADPQRFPRLKNMPRADAVYGMAKIVSQAFLYRGQTVDPTNVRFIASSLVEELMEDKIYGAPFLSLAEIQVVVKRAILGASEMYGITVSSLYRVIMEFAKGEGHQNEIFIAKQKH